jgi:hypothetical protein
MMHPAWIEFIERLSEFAKALGSALAKLAWRLRTEPSPKTEHKD